MCRSVRLHDLRERVLDENPDDLLSFSEYGELAWLELRDKVARLKFTLFAPLIVWWRIRQINKPLAKP